MSGSKTTIVWGLFIASALASSAWAAHPRSAVTAKAAILIDNQTGEVLWQRNADLPLPPASTTKIVTAMVALQSGRLDDSIVVTPEAALAPPSKISLRAGWRMRVRDLVYALLLNSANDAAVALADGLAGSVPGFAERMNAVARALGATKTHFVNPNGLPADNHYSTARDLATMFGRALQNPIFENVVSTKTTSISPAAGSTRRIMLRNHNRLLGNYRIQVVGKTGWTRAAKKCFVGAGRVGGREIGIAVLGSTDLWGDVKHLLEYGLGAGGAPEPATPEVEMAATEMDSAAGDDDDTNVRAARRAQRYFVDVRSVRSMPSAKRPKNSLRQAGYHASVQKIRHERHPLHRVLVGSYPSRRTAKQAAIKLKNKHPRPSALVFASR
jgi:serine-type D-Ala-D-Ala carboxypeptidase (penicillin-binding protein 5/6)